MSKRDGSEHYLQRKRHDSHLLHALSFDVPEMHCLTTHTSLHYPSGVVLCVCLCPSLSGPLYPRPCNKLLSMLGGPLVMSDRFSPSCFFYISLSAVANNITLLRYITIKASCQDTQLHPRVAEQRKRGEVFDRDTLSSPKPSLI